MANGLPITKRTFEALQTDAKLDALFDVLEHMNSSGYESEEDREEHRNSCEERFKALEKRKWLDASKASGFGAIAGFIAGLFK